MPSSPKTITARRRDVQAALRGLEKVVKERGFGDIGIAKLVGRTMRQLREAAGETQDAIDVVSPAYAKKDEQDRPIPTADGRGYVIEDMRGLVLKLNELMAEEQPVEIFPFPLRALGDPQKPGKPLTCSKCKQVTGLPDPEDLATLLDLGILTEQSADEVDVP